MNNMISSNNNNNNQKRFAPATIWDLMSRPLSDFDDMFRPLAAMQDDFKVDLKDCGDKYVLHADMPGVKKQNIELRYDNGVLSIKAEHHTHQNIKDEETGFLIRERSAGTFSRSIPLEDVDPNGIEATFENATLKVELKKAEHKTSGNIEVKQA